MNSISSLFFRLNHENLPARQMAELIEFTQNNGFFQLAAAKQIRSKQLRTYFSRHGIQKIVLSANLGGFAYRHPIMNVELLEKNFFQASDSTTQAAKKKRLDGAIVIINNNDISDRAFYANFYDDCDQTLFVIWDWDNHHWLDLSTFLAAHSDIYAPAHHEHLYLLTRYNWLTCGPVYSASVQWSRALLMQHLPEIITTHRSCEPLGRHIPYQTFGLRMKTVNALSRHYQEIGFSDHSYHNKTPEERLREWYSHKIHWIIPVLNDVPIRIFDALITGGIPIIPESLRHLPPISGISDNSILFYRPDDVEHPQSLIEKANHLFDQGGTDHLIERHRFCLNMHHGDSRIAQMLNYAENAFQVKKLTTTSTKYQSTHQKANANTSSKSNDLIVLVPIYRPQLELREHYSLDHSISVLSKQRIFFIGPTSLDRSYYLKHYKNIQFLAFDDVCFSSVAEYNRLLLKSSFYALFKAYEFMLILQTDAIILRDELNFWCIQPFDYIGAPWPDSHSLEIFIDTDRYSNATRKKLKLKVGNGGLSLRRIKKCMAVLDEFPETAMHFINKKLNEDMFFSATSMLSNDFIAPNEIIASRFSLELQPSYYYAINGNQMPMGGHAWWVYEPQFWLPHLKNKDVKLNVCRN